MWNKDDEQCGEQPTYEDHIEKIVNSVTNSLKRYSNMRMNKIIRDSKD